MSEQFLADTSYWAAIANPRDDLHRPAVRWYEHLESAPDRILTTDWILAETVQLVEVRAPQRRAELLDLIEDIRSDAAVECIHVSRRLRDAAWMQLAGRPDRHWSWTDAVSIVVMRERSLGTALSADSHFREAGLTPALELDPDSYA